MEKAGIKNIYFLKNIVQEYAWGSPTLIPGLMGYGNSEKKPQAEMWIGAHPKAPSLVIDDGKTVPLSRFISESPEEILGSDAAKRFDNSLPFLLKILAAQSPLSIQVHPNLQQARDGFARENSTGIPLDSPERNYRDANHKPETVCALTPFQALNGFREPSEAADLLKISAGTSLENEIKLLERGDIKSFYTRIMTMDSEERNRLLSEFITSAGELQHENGIFRWCMKLHNDFPGDIGILSPVILNLVRLEPGLSMNLAAGQLHAYLQGLAVEIMANSDNVIRRRAYRKARGYPRTAQHSVLRPCSH